jgi:hypothetical protein
MERLRQENLCEFQESPSSQIIKYLWFERSLKTEYFCAFDTEQMSVAVVKQVVFAMPRGIEEANYRVSVSGRIKEIMHPLLR